MKDIEQEILIEILKHKLQYFNTITDGLMLWWVSSVVFAGTILGGVLIYHEKVKSLPDCTKNVLFTVVLIFFLSFLVHGRVGGGGIIQMIHEDIVELVQQLHMTENIYGYSETELHGIRGVLFLGSLTFFYTRNHLDLHVGSYC